MAMRWGLPADLRRRASVNGTTEINILISVVLRYSVSPCDSVISATSVALEIELRADLEEARGHDLQRIEIRRSRCRVGGRIRPLEHFSRVRVEQVVDVEVDHRPAIAVPKDLAEAKID